MSDATIIYGLTVDVLEKRADADEALAAYIFRGAGANLRSGDASAKAALEWANELVARLLASAKAARALRAELLPPKAATLPATGEGTQSTES